MLTPERVIELLGLEPLPVEGGYFRETYRASDIIPAAALPERYGEAKPFGSAIYYFLHRDYFSALHRLRTDEVYHFYLGDPVEMLLLFPNGASDVIALGNDLESGQRVQVIAPRDAWQGSRLAAGGRFALLGTTMAPAFDPTDFELGNRDELLHQYPTRGDLILALTPDR